MRLQDFSAKNFDRIIAEINYDINLPELFTAK